MIRKIVFLLNGHDAVLRRWAVAYLSEALVFLGYDSKIIDIAKGGNELECYSADVIVVYRCFDLRVIRIMQRLREAKKFIIFFMDDYIFQPNCKYSPPKWKMPSEPFDLSSAFMSSSGFLLSKMPPNKPKILRRSVLDSDGMATLKQEYRRNGEFSVGWLSGAGRGNIWDKFVAEMLDLLNDSLAGQKVWFEQMGQKKIAFHCYGSRFLKTYSHLDIKEHLFMAPEDWKGLYTQFKSFNLGCVINPLDEADEFCNSKSELKFVESAAMGVPLITSRVVPYTEFIKEGELGCFASTPKEFAIKIVELINNESLSRSISANANQYVVKNYNVIQNAHRFMIDVAIAKEKTI